MYIIFNFIDCKIHRFYDLFDNGKCDLLRILIRQLVKKDNIIMYDMFRYSDQLLYIRR